MSRLVRIGRMDEIRDFALASRTTRGQEWMSQLTEAFSVNKRGFSPAGGAAVALVLKPEPEHAADSEPVGRTGDLSTLMRTVARRIEGEPP